MNDHGVKGKLLLVCIESSLDGRKKTRSSPLVDPLHVLDHFIFAVGPVLPHNLHRGQISAGDSCNILTVSYHQLLTPGHCSLHIPILVKTGIYSYFSIHSQAGIILLRMCPVLLRTSDGNQWLCVPASSTLHVTFVTCV